MFGVAAYNLMAPLGCGGRLDVKREMGISCLAILLILFQVKSFPAALHCGCLCNADVHQCMYNHQWLPLLVQHFEAVQV